MYIQIYSQKDKVTRRNAPTKYFLVPPEGHNETQQSQILNSHPNPKNNADYHFPLEGNAIEMYIQIYSQKDKLTGRNASTKYYLVPPEGHNETQQSQILNSHPNPKNNADYHIPLEGNAT
ncbi:hypothetical protein CDAR_579401 [Caerostris darwini]|uniref:Uncharacterized protein n=1 Tax=Caerostris darwini TaxID=1538125 RepID=A0AAV4V2H8_9ARAC|nr:hypothetical protein CDAR_579401 [Caerostris darwini]